MGLAVTCPGCRAENAEGKRFCGDCGHALTLSCPSCGAAVEPGKRFCGDCGSALGTVAGAPNAAAPEAARPAREPARRVAERRLTTILFGDLVGFTTLSETRDAEDVRELLSQYFAMATTVVSRYGGTVEKFIGDAVMAVWGVPVAHEDDAERAVRAGLDLVGEVAVLAGSVGIPDLNMRVGILSGEVAVTLGAVGEGMVAGDAVNTAARIQSAAPPGQVWVDETTRSLTSAAVAYRDAGEHLLKGKAEPVRLHAAGVVVASVGGNQRVDGLEAPFVGRDHELRLVKDLFHGAIGEGRARLVAVSGLAGVGKTRLAWEFEKYVDGIREEVLWHRGRALSYGDGAGFWALAEMVRSRLGVLDGEPANVVDQKLSEGLARFVAEPDEREWLRPRLVVLLGLASTSGTEPVGFGRDDLFSAWVSFFEHVSGGEGVVMVVDDMQHAERDLLDFLEYLLETARFPLFVLTLARPELVDARPGWGSGRRATNVYLEPLAEPAMAEIVNGLVHGLPEKASRALVERSEGVPLYALEMVRGLIDRDVVIPHEGRYVVAPDADQRVDPAALDAPPSLHALIAARLDALTPAERQLVQDATVHGMVFSRDGIEFVSDVADLDAVLAELVRKEILELQKDRFSPERGQYRFVQSLVRSVAYETLSKRDRKTRHLAVAGYLTRTAEGDEMAAIVARHYLDALDSAPDDADAGDLSALAVDHLERAGRRAEALGSYDEALRLYTSAVARRPDTALLARLLEGSTRAAHFSARLDDAQRYADQAIAAYESLGQPVDAGRVTAALGDVLLAGGHTHDALERMLPAYERLDGISGADGAILPLAFHLSRAFSAHGDRAHAAPYRDRAMQLAEGRQDWERLIRILNGMALDWLSTGRPVGGVALLRAAVDLGRREHLRRAMIMPLGNIAAMRKDEDLNEARAAGQEALELALQTGALHQITRTLCNIAITDWLSGDWDEVEDLHERYHEHFGNFPTDDSLFGSVLALIRSARGQPNDVELVVPEVEADNWDEMYIRTLAEALLADAKGDGEETARRFARALDDTYRSAGIEDDFVLLWPIAVEYVLAAGDITEADRLVAYVAGAPAGHVKPLSEAHLRRLRALVAIAHGASEVEIDADLEDATRAFRDLGVPFYLAKTLLERGRRQAEGGATDAAAPLLEEATAVFTGLRADRWVAEAQGVGAAT